MSLLNEGFIYWASLVMYGHKISGDTDLSSRSLWFKDLSQLLGECKQSLIKINQTSISLSAAAKHMKMTFNNPSWSLHCLMDVSYQYIPVCECVVEGTAAWYLPSSQQLTDTRSWHWAEAAGVQQLSESFQWLAHSQQLSPPQLCLLYPAATAPLSR